MYVWRVAIMYVVSTIIAMCVCKWRERGAESVSESSVECKMFEEDKL